MALGELLEFIEGHETSEGCKVWIIASSLLVLFLFTACSKEPNEIRAPTQEEIEDWGKPRAPLALPSRDYSADRRSENLDDARSLAYKLAVIDAGTLVRKDDKIVNQYLLTLLMIKGLTSNSLAEIADASVEAQERVQHSGVDMRLMDVMIGIAATIPESVAPGSADYRGYAWRFAARFVR